MSNFKEEIYTKTSSGIILLNKPAIQRLSLYIPDKKEDIFTLEKTLTQEFDKKLANGVKC